MIDDASVIELIHAHMPDARVEVADWSSFGTRDHLNVTVVSSAFSGKTRLDQHRMVYAALGEALKDGRIHAVQIKTSELE
ncbi:MAG: BolA/IbaG family iron-sulfur metabolism protein [Candidatus Eremiobacteraeota bacterium]|nr:BolA/IbaG family iron-sulfur metabolism protein [Candidatus Eremiobacteraeota bacterium]